MGLDRDPLPQRTTAVHHDVNAFPVFVCGTVNLGSEWEGLVVHVLNGYLKPEDSGRSREVLFQRPKA